MADGEERYRAIEELFASADRLSGDPDSTSRRDDLRVAFRAYRWPVPPRYAGRSVVAVPGLGPGR